ncbi:MAG: T9SS type A sorting domain-containing protein [Chitinophagaceae bacterium]
MTSNRFFSFLLLLFLPIVSVANTITISTAASSGSGWSISGGVITASANVTINNGSINSYLVSGDLTITAGTNVVIQGSINPALGTGVTRNLVIRAGGNIVVEAGYTVSCASGSLNLIFCSDADAAGGGFIYAKSGSVVNSKGGHIWMGGGSGSATWNGLTVGDGYAAGSTTVVIPSSELQSGANASGFRNGISFYNNTVQSEGGHILLKGRGAALTVSYGYMGLYMGYNATVNSAAGNINIDASTAGATSAIAAGWFYGLLMIPTNNTNNAYGIASIESTSGNITIEGSASQNQNANHNAGIALFTQNATAVARIKSVSGNIDITGSTQNTSNPSYGGIFLTGTGNEQIISQTGNITLSGNSASTSYPGINANSDSQIGYDGTNAYSGNITLIADQITLAAAVQLRSTGNLQVYPVTSTRAINIAGTGGLSLPATFFTSNAADGFNNIHIGNGSQTGNIQLAAITFRDNTTLESNGLVTQTGAITASGQRLHLAGTAGSFAFTNAGNQVQSLSAQTGALHFINSTALQLENINIAGGLQVETLSGDLTVTNNIHSDNTGPAAIRLYADANKLAGDATGGNIIISGSPSVTTGAGGRASLYTGSSSGSTGLLSLVGSSANVRANVDAFTPAFSPALGAGIYALYREVSVVLPVGLTRFSATCQSGVVQLNWATASEQNNDGFYPEKSTDGITWQEIGFVEGAGNSSQTRYYQYADKTGSSGTVYYRLRQMDFDGKAYYSTVIVNSCQANKAGLMNVILAPNPAGSVTYLKFLPGNATVVQYSLVSMSGTSLLNGKWSGTEASLDLSGMANGVYLLRLTTDRETRTIRVVRK